MRVRKISFIIFFQAVLTQVIGPSPLGEWLQSPEGTPPPRRIDSLNGTASRPAVIFIWKYGPTLERRHLRRFQTNRFSPWDGCSVDDCTLTYDFKDLLAADAVLFHLHRMTKSDAAEAAAWARRNRRPEQLWIFLIDESPVHTVLHPEYAGLFNWSMSYRSDSDVPVAYGRAISKKTHEILDIERDIKKKTRLVAVMGSNCSGWRRSGSNRWKYIEILRQHLTGQLEIFGHCLDGNTTACPGHFAVDCPLLNDYKFYLAFENSNCVEYMTEKVFWNAYSKLAIPVIMGAPRSDCERLLPPGSFLHVDDFVSPAELARFLLVLDQDPQRFFKYHAWRSKYVVLNEHGYFGSPSRHFCRVCEALRYNSINVSKTYWDLGQYWRREDCSIDDSRL